MMLSSYRKKIAILLVLLQVFMAFLVLAGASKMDVLFYIGLLSSLIISFIFYYILVSEINENVSTSHELVSTSEIDQISNHTKIEVDIDDAINEHVLMTRYKELLQTESESEAILSVLAYYYNMVQGAVYERTNTNEFKSAALYAWFRDDLPAAFCEGETLPGQVALNKKYLYLNSIPDDYVSVFSGLGNATPRYLLFIPIIKNGLSQKIIEAAFFKSIDIDSVEVINKWVGEISLA